jgi:hypothetical protein
MAGTLRFFRMVWTSEILSPTQYIPFLAKISRLQSLEVLDLFWGSHWNDFPDDKVTFPRLHTIKLGTPGGGPESVMDKIATSWELPALRSLSVNPAHQFEDAFVPILKRHGHHLTMLRLPVGYPNELLELISRFCPLVEEISVEVIRMWIFGPEIDAVPVEGVNLQHVRLICIEGRLFPENSTMLDDLLRFIFKISTPSLLSIRLKAFSTSDAQFGEMASKYMEKMGGGISPERNSLRR